MRIYVSFRKHGLDPGAKQHYHNAEMIATQRITKRAHAVLPERLAVIETMSAAGPILKEGEMFETRAHAL